MSVNKYVNGKLLQMSGNADTRLTVEDILNILGYAPANPTTIAETYATTEYVNGTFVKSVDIVDNTTSTDTDKPLSANQGTQLKSEIDTLIANFNNATTKRYKLTGSTVDLSSIPMGIYIVTLTCLSVNNSIGALGIIQKSNSTTMYMTLLSKSETCNDWTVTKNGTSFTLNGTNVYSATVWSLVMVNATVV